MCTILARSQSIPAIELRSSLVPTPQEFLLIEQLRSVRIVGGERGGRDRTEVPLVVTHHVRHEPVRGEYGKWAVPLR